MPPRTSQRPPALLSLSLASGAPRSLGGKCTSAPGRYARTAPAPPAALCHETAASGTRWGLRSRCNIQRTARRWCEYSCSVSPGTALLTACAMPRHTCPTVCGARAQRERRALLRGLGLRWAT
jgi:hypothetical protein